MLKKDILKEMVDRTVREVLSERKKDNLDLVIESVVNKQLRSLIKEEEDNKEQANKKQANKKRNVLQWLNQDTVNKAAVRREVEGQPEDQEEEDAKRSYFIKKVNQDDGKDFSDDEVNALYALKSRLGQLI